MLCKAFFVVVLVIFSSGVSAQQPEFWTVPVATKTMSNGLTVVVSQDRASPTVAISVLYRVGTRLEPRGRAGFAHLFEHLMFKGTARARDGVHSRVVNGGGGFMTAFTRPDYTHYVSIIPSSALEAVLWLEADRMQALDLTEEKLVNQRAVVAEEIASNITNAPYGGFMWIDINDHAFQRWENRHGGYGSEQELARASVPDLAGFHRDYYGPSNAVLSIAGDLTFEQGFDLAEKYFGDIGARPAPAAPDVSEPFDTGEKRVAQPEHMAEVPALVAAWRLPERGSRDQAAMVVLAELLAGGTGSRLHQQLIKGKQLALKVDSHGDVGPWEYGGPTLLTVFVVYKQGHTADAVLEVVDAEIERVVVDGVSEADLGRLKTRMLGDWYRQLDPLIARADILAKLQAVWGDANVVNDIPKWMEGVTSADLQRVAQTYLTRSNRTVIDRVPAALTRAHGTPQPNQ